MRHSQKRTVAAMTMGGHEGVGAAIVAGVDATPVLEPAEHVLDAVPLTVEGLVVSDLDFAVDLGGMQAAIPRSARASRNQSAS